MSIPLFWVVAFASGLAFALLGMVYRFAQGRQVAPMHVLVGVSLTGTLWFAAKSPLALIASTPLLVWAIAVVAGTTQYISIKLITAALRKGPLSPVWCMMNLFFLPVVVWSFVAWREPLGPWQIAAIAAAILCVLFASKAQSPPPGADQKIKANPLVYGLLLVALLLANSLSGVGIKDLGCRSVGAGDPAKLIDVFGNVYLMCFYAVLGLWIVGETFVRRCYPTRLGLSLLLGVIGAGCSVGGMTAYAYCAPHPAAVWSTVSGMSGIIMAALGSVICFKEKVSVAWACMLLFAVLSLLLVFQ